MDATFQPFTGNDIQRALDAGATPDEIRAMTRQGTAAQRATVEAVLTLPEEEPGPLPEEKDDIAEIMTPSNGEYVETRAAVEAGEGNEFLKMWEEEGANRIFNTPVMYAVGDEDPASDIAVIEQAYTDPGGRAKTGIVENARALPGVLREDLDALEAVQSEHRKLANVRMEQYRAIERAMLDAKLDAEERASGYNSDFMSTTGPWTTGNLVALGAELAPRNLIDRQQLAIAAERAGILPEGWVNNALAYLAPGSQVVEIRENLLKLSPDEVYTKLSEFIKVYRNMLPMELRSDFNVYLMMTEIFPEEDLFTGEDMGALFDHTVGNALGLVANLAETAAALGFFVAGPVSLAAGTGFSTSVRGIGASVRGWRASRRVMAAGSANNRLLQAQNPSRFKAALQQEVAKTGGKAADVATTRGLDIAQSQLPAPGGVADEPMINMPDGVFDEHDIMVLKTLGEDAVETANRLNAGFMDATEQAKVVDHVVQELDHAHGGRVRPALSQIEVLDDYSGVKFQMAVGASDTRGFKSAQEAFDYASTEIKANNFEFLRVLPNGEVVKFKPTIDAKTGKVTAPPGEYYLRMNMEHKFKPEDTLLFDGDPSLAGAWQGRFLGILTNPSAYFDPKTVGRFTRQYLREQRLAKTLDAIAQPIFTRLGAKSRAKVNDALIWAEKQAEGGMIPSAEDVKAKFDMSDGEVQGFYRGRYLQDTMYRINNNRLRNNWAGRGYKTVASADGSKVYHGLPLPYNTKLAKQAQWVYDPETGRSREFTPEDLEKWYADGNRLIEVDLPLRGSRGRQHKIVAVDAARGYKMRELDRNVLEYRPMYNTRMYEDAHFVQRVKLNAALDGDQVKELSTTLRTARTRQEAEIFRRRLMDGVGRRIYKEKWNKSAPISVKEQMLRDKNYEVRISEDGRLSDSDRIQVDLGKMHLEGRLFFDDRQAKVLKNTDGDVADVVDPLNVIQRATRVVARHQSTENLVDAQKMQWKRRYGDLTTGARRKSSEIDAELTSKISENRGQAAIRATRARAWWRYIRFMEGTMNANPSAFRKFAIAASEWVDYNIGGKIGGRKYTTALSRKAGDTSLVNAAKSAAFLHFLTARPVRQLVMQGAQHLNLQAIDLTYAGKWQMDTFSLLSAIKRLEKTEQNQLTTGLKKQQAARMMGLKDDEIEVVLQEFRASGLLDGVDVHSYAGGAPKGQNSIPTTGAVGAVGQRVGNALRYIPDKARAMGFDLGEQYNVTASWLMALRRHMKENGIKKIGDLNSKDWDDIAARGSGYALGMHKANAAQWQYGLVSLPLQFLQFTHKWLLTMLGANKKMRKLGLANQAFTQEESLKILAGQMVMWGGAGFAVGDAFRDHFDQPRFAAMPDEAKDLIAAGLVDYVADEFIRRLADDPDLDFAFEDTFAPGMGLTMLIEKVGEVWLDKVRVPEILLGPFGQVGGRWAKALDYTSKITGASFSHLSPEEKTKMVLTAIGEGLFSSVADWQKIEIARATEQWVSSRGVNMGLKIKTEEMIMKGAFGINPQQVDDYYDGVYAARIDAKDVKQAAQDHVQSLDILWRRHRSGEKEADWFLTMAQALASQFETMENIGQGQAYRDAFLDEMRKRRTDDGKSFFRLIAEMLMEGYTGDAVEIVLNRGLIEPGSDDERMLREELERQLRTSADAMADEQVFLEQDAADIRREVNGD